MYLLVEFLVLHIMIRCHIMIPFLSYKHIYFEILQNIKYDITMIVLYDSMHCRDDII
jgi:hypothetical protein